MAEFLDLTSSTTAVCAYITCICVSNAVHVLLRPVFREALASVSPLPDHLRNTDRVITNICKATSLLILCSWEGFWSASYDAFVLNTWANLSLTRKITIMYTVTDASSFLTTWMPPSTFYHHLATSVFAAWVCIDPNILSYGAARLILWYGLCSTLTFCVNAYIATIYLFSKPLVSLARTCVVIYGLSLAINWVKLFPDLYFLVIDSSPWMSILYVACVAVLVYDDQRLMKKLLEYSSVEKCKV